MVKAVFIDCMGTTVEEHSQEMWGSSGASALLNHSPPVGKSCSEITAYHSAGKGNHSPSADVR